MAERMTTKETLLAQGVAALEPLRARWFLFTVLMWSTIIVGFFIFIMTFRTPEVNLGIAVLFLILFFVFWAINRTYRIKCFILFDEWRNNLLKQIDKSAAFHPKGYVGSTYFDSSNLSSRVYNVYSGSNHLQVGEMQASVISIKSRYTETYYSNGQTRYRTKVDPVYDGMFLVLPAPTPHPSRVMLQPKQGITQGLINAMLKSNKTDMLDSGLHKITVASNDLMNNYKIGVSDKFGGHRILTPLLMQSLWDYRKGFMNAPRYSYRNDTLYILITGLSLGCGERPTKWAAVTLSKLNKVADDCENAVNFLKETSAKLMPA